MPIGRDSCGGFASRSSGLYSPLTGDGIGCFADSGFKGGLEVGFGAMLANVLRHCGDATKRWADSW
jgi:hypothetical protein